MRPWSDLVTFEQSTDSPARPPLAERDTLELGEIAMLEFPTDRTARGRWCVALKVAIHHGLLPARTENRQRPGSRVNRDFLRLPPIENPPVVESRYFISRNDYRTWRRANAPTPSEPCFIEEWLVAQNPAQPKSETPRLSELDIKKMRESGMSREKIHEEYPIISKHRIGLVDKRFKIQPLPPGPKPKS